MNQYDKKAMQFCRETGTRVECRLVGTLSIDPRGDEPAGVHNVYAVSIERNGKLYCKWFHDSITNYKACRRPSVYSILACVWREDPGQFWDFVREFGWKTSSEEAYRKAMEAYLSCAREYAAVKELFGDVLDQLREFN